MTLSMRPGITGLITNIGFVSTVAADGFIGNNSAIAVSTVAYPLCQQP